MTKRLSVLALCLTSSLTTHAGLAAESKPLYSIAKSVAIGAPDRWDLLAFEPQSQRVYITHGDRVTVVNGRSGAVVGQIEGFAGGTHGVALVSQLDRGYSDDGKAGTAVSFSLKTLKQVKQVPADQDADAIVYDPKSGHVFVIDSDPGKITVIDPKTDTVVATIDGGGKLEIGDADGAGKLYVNVEANKEIIRIDTAANAIDARWPIPACESPHGLAIDAAAHRIFASCENNLMVVVDAGDGRVVASLPIGSRTDGAAFDPVRKRAFSSNGDGTLTVIGEKDPNNYEVLGNVQTARGARTMTIDPKTGRLYLVAADYKVNESVPESDARHRYTVVPGSAKLLMLDPAS